MPHLLTLALALAATAGARAVTWTTGAEARAGMETYIKAQAVKLQASYADIKATEALPSCPHRVMCDADTSSWSLAMAKPQFQDADGSCVSLDLDSSGNILTAPVTGRTTYAVDADNCNWKFVDKDGSGVFVENSQSKSDYLESTGCIQSSDLTECTIDAASYGTTFPDAAPVGDTDFDKRVQSEICATNMLHDEMETFTTDHAQTGWHFLGLQETGLYRTSPSLYQCRTENQCSGCSDPRFRGWYASAASGPKDVVIVLDTSGSMSSNDRLTKALTAAKWVINTLSETDYATVVSYASSAASASTELLQMTAVNRATLKDYIDGLGAFGGTNMHAGLTMAFDLLDPAVTASDTTGCSKLILFLTDGQNTGDKDPALVADLRNGGPYGESNEDRLREIDYNRIFTYSFGDGADTEFMKKLACDNGGVFTQIGDDDGDSLKETMAGYYAYLAAGIAPMSEAVEPTVRWVDPYEDGQGRGQMTAVCAPVFDFTEQPALLFGVTCVGIWKTVTDGLTGWSAEWSAIQMAQQSCPALNFDWDELESLRHHEGKRSACDYDGDDEEGGVDLGLILGLVFGLGCGAVLIAGVVWACWPKPKANSEVHHAQAVVVPPARTHDGRHNNW